MPSSANQVCNRFGCARTVADRSDLSFGLCAYLGLCGKLGKKPKVPVEPDSAFCVVADRSHAMQKDKSSQGIVLDEKSQEQPRDKERAQTAHKTQSGHMPRQPVKQDDELQQLREKSGF
jgi:hypothetical protein